MLNKYVWELYINSSGKECISFFHDSLISRLPDTYAEKIFLLHSKYCVSESVLMDTKRQLLFLTSVFREDELKDITASMEYLDDESNFEEIEEDIEYIFDENYDFWSKENKTDKEIFIHFVNNISYYSTSLACLYPGLFIPYYYFANYNALSMIASVFDISLPEIPRKADYESRTWHYAELCKSLYHFRRENHLSYFELCAFLYDFAPNYIGGYNSYIIKDLPRPKAAYFVGGGGNNEDAVAENNQNEIIHWQSNPDTRAGDMIVMYLRTPISAISSIWRSQSVGFIDPFFFYYQCTFIGKPQKVSRLSIKDIKADPVLGKMPIVSKNMQGINGVELKPSEYNYIVEISGANVPTLEFEAPNNAIPFTNEKEVEEKLIKPLLKEVGYSEQDYVQQMYIEIGNHNNALIPDFVLNPVSSGGHYSGFAVLEAKRSIKNEKELNKTKIQVRSYAKILGARYAVIVSAEKVWITSSEDDYSKNIFEETWDALQDKNTIYDLEKLIGQKADRSGR